MTSPLFSEKDGLVNLPVPAPSEPPPSKSAYLDAISPLTNAWNRYSEWRTSFGLPNPGQVEQLQKEVKATLATNFLFEGGRADLTKSLSMNPAFQVTHSFALGSQAAPSSYNFGAVFANENIFLQGGFDHDGNVNARMNQGWTANSVTKFNGQFSSQVGHNMLQVEHDYQGIDYSINGKAVNIWPTDLTGIYVGSYLQSLTKNLALGFEGIYQRPTPDMAELTASWLAKYTSDKKDWIATAQLQPQGMLQATYWHKLSEKVEVAADLQVIAAPTRRDAIATLGAKYDLRMATFRAQLDSTGKVSALLEQRFAPTLAFLLSGEIDHAKNTAKVGAGVMIESSSLTPEEMGLPPQP
jgi:mitochondrial import receptor subunit TOM40